MSEFRRDPVVGRWVIIATDRGKRPSDFLHEPVSPPRKGFCPFCAGNEHYTPPEILAYRRDGSRPNTPGWFTRVVPNKYPALKVEGSLNKAADGMYDRMNGIGAHEVIIEHPDHAFSLAFGDPEHTTRILRAWRERLADLRKDKRLRSAMIFKNYGREAGASLEHPHTQLIAIPNVPKRLQEELHGCREYYEWKERCVFLDIISHETAAGSRLVMENQRFIALEPYAPRFPFETWILPKQPQSHFEQIRDEDLLDLARALTATLGKLKVVLRDSPYNFVLHTAPWTEEPMPHYQWHLEIIPKVIHIAGFEWGSGFYINPMPPEDAAAALRAATAEDLSRPSEEGPSLAAAPSAAHR